MKTKKLGSKQSINDLERWDPKCYLALSMYLMSCTLKPKKSIIVQVPQCLSSSPKRWSILVRGGQKIPSYGKLTKICQLR